VGWGWPEWSANGSVARRTFRRAGTGCNAGLACWRGPVNGWHITGGVGGHARCGEAGVRKAAGSEAEIISGRASVLLSRVAGGGHRRITSIPDPDPPGPDAIGRNSPGPARQQGAVPRRQLMETNCRVIRSSWRSMSAVARRRRGAGFDPAAAIAHPGTASHLGRESMRAGHELPARVSNPLSEGATPTEHRHREPWRSGPRLGSMRQDRVPHRPWAAPRSVLLFSRPQRQPRRLACSASQAAARGRGCHGVSVERAR